MKTPAANVVTDVARYDGTPAPAERCPECGAPVFVVYQESRWFSGLELVAACADDCGYTPTPCLRAGPNQ